MISTLHGRQLCVCCEGDVSTQHWVWVGVGQQLHQLHIPVHTARDVIFERATQSVECSVTAFRTKIAQTSLLNVDTVLTVPSWLVLYCVKVGSVPGIALPPHVGTFAVAISLFFQFVIIWYLCLLNLTNFSFFPVSTQLSPLNLGRLTCTQSTSILGKSWPAWENSSLWRSTYLVVETYHSFCFACSSNEGIYLKWFCPELGVGLSD